MSAQKLGICHISEAPSNKLPYKLPQLQWLVHLADMHKKVQLYRNIASDFHMAHKTYITPDPALT